MSLAVYRAVTKTAASIAFLQIWDTRCGSLYRAFHRLCGFHGGAHLDAAAGSAVERKGDGKQGNCIALRRTMYEEMIDGADYPTMRRPLGPVFFTIQQPWTGYSGGTIGSILSGLETYSLRQMMAASAPRASCILDAGPHRPHPAPSLPVRRDRFLGDLTFNPSAMADQAVVMHTWSLLQRFGNQTERYGDRFRFQGYTAAQSWLQAWSSFLTISVAVFCTLVFPPLRWLLRWLSTQPGTGPQLKPGERHFVEWKATAAADGTDVSEPNALGVMRMNMDVYSVCATLVAEVALTLLQALEGKEEGSMVNKLGGGILTPALLGIPYVRRLEKAGLRWKVTEIRGKEE